MIQHHLGGGGAGGAIEILAVNSEQSELLVCSMNRIFTIYI